MKFTQVGTFKSGKTVESDTLIFCHDNNLAVVLAELKAADYMSDMDLMFQND